MASWSGPSARLPSLGYEPLDVASMELPPGWRGYGARDYVDHPDSVRRTAEVQALRERSKGQARREVQEALMPFRHLLPERLRAANERLGEQGQ